MKMKDKNSNKNKRGRPVAIPVNGRRAFLDVEKIEGFRWDSRLNKGTFAEMIGIGPSAYSKMLTRRNVPRAPILIRIAEIMGVEESSLIVY